MTITIAAILALLAAGAAPQPPSGRAGSGEAGFGYYYQWNPTTEQWDLHYGSHASLYEQGPPPAELAQPGAVMAQSVLRGRVQRVERAELLPGQGEAAIATLRLPGGRAEYVSLGRWEDLDGLGLRRGDELVVRGRQGFVGNTPVFMASAVDAGGWRAAVSQPLLLSQDEPPGPRLRPAAQRRAGQRGAITAPSPAGRRAAEIGGQVQDLAYTMLPGVSPETVLVRLLLADGQEWLVSLGSGVTAHQLDRVEGAQRVQVRGRLASVGGEEVILAERVTVDGYTFGVR